MEAAICLKTISSLSLSLSLSLSHSPTQRQNGRQRACATCPPDAGYCSS